jgi:hypothetical protein
LYDDCKGAFFSALKQKPNLQVSCPLKLLLLLISIRPPLKEFEQLGVAGIPKPVSQLPFPLEHQHSLPTPHQTYLLQERIVFLVRGMKNSLCNRACYEISEPATFTAEVIQALIKDGAQILGLMKLSSTIAREEPMDAVDYPTALNPRGDGYQSPAGSSSGSAADMAAHDWLDCSIGTDTSGSGRRPALANSVWQFRPSHDSISLRGLVKTYAMFDTPCVFARSPDVLRRVADTWIAPPSPVKKRPYRLIYPLDYLPTESLDQMTIINSLIRDMETYLPSNIIPLPIRSSWQQSHPPGTPNDVEQYLHNVFQRTYYHQFYHSTENFRKVYAEKHDGQRPYVIALVQRIWAQGASVSDAEHEEGTRRLLVYKA